MDNLENKLINMADIEDHHTVLKLPGTSAAIVTYRGQKVLTEWGNFLDMSVDNLGNVDRVVGSNTASFNKVTHMYEMLKPGGKLVTPVTVNILSKKHTANTGLFIKWLNQVGYNLELIKERALVLSITKKVRK